MKEILVVLLVLVCAACAVVFFVPHRIQEAERARIIQHDKELEWKNEEWRESLEREGQLAESLP